MAADIDYTEYKTVDEVETELEKRKSALHRTCKQQQSLQEDKRTTAKGYNDQLKELKLQIEETVAVIDGLQAQRKFLEQQG